MRYCVVGNIIDKRIDKNGQVRYGTSTFAGGTKVYLCGRNRDPLWENIGVIGLSRSKRLEFRSVPQECIVNLRVQKVFQPSILKILDEPEMQNCCWGRTENEKKYAEYFVRAWNSVSRDARNSFDIFTDDYKRMLDGELEYILFYDVDIWQLNEKSCDCDSVLIKFRNKDKLVRLGSHFEHFSICTVADYDAEAYCWRFTPPENISAKLVSARYKNGAPFQLKFSYGDRYLFFSADDYNIIVLLSLYDNFKENETPLPEYDDSILKITRSVMPSK